jgi:uncharacterized protein involved in propanediol utilization
MVDPGRQLDGRMNVRVEGHFGELLQGRLGPGGPVVLVTLPCAALTVAATPASVRDPHGLLPAPRARALLDHLGLREPPPYALTATMPRGGGAGASTAALVALARFAGSDHAPDCLARACVAVEGASDPLMFPAPERLLWASRQAETIEVLPPLPPFEVLGGFYGPNRRTDPSDREFADIADLIGPWRSAAGSRDLATLAVLASRSAERNIARRGPAADPTARLAAKLGALGHVIAHTGSARGLLFAPGTIPERAGAHLASNGFRRIVRFAAGGGDK